MTKVEAVIELMMQSRTEKMSTASAKRAVKACKALGMPDKETREIMSWLDYCDPITGEPYKAHGVKRVWP